jgi:hypothetical protein
MGRRATAPSPFPTGKAHLSALFERVRLLLTRHIVRYWYRLTDSVGEINTLCVSLDEVRRSLAPSPSGAPPGEGARLPTLAEVEAELGAHAVALARRVEASQAAGVALPAETLRARLALDPLGFDLVMLLAALQLDVGLHRLATFAWADFALKQPSLGFAAEVIALGDASLRDRVLACASPGHRLLGLHVIEPIQDQGWGAETPELFLRLRLSARVVAALLDRPSPLEGTSPGDSPQAHDALDLYCRLLDAPQPLAALGQPPEVGVLFARAQANAQRVRDVLASRAELIGERVAVISFIGSLSADHASVAAACAPGRLALEVRLAAVFAQQPEPLSLSRERVESLLARALREAALLDATPVILLDDLFDRLSSPDPIIAALSRLLPLVASAQRGGLGGLVVLSLRDMHPRLRHALGPCAVIKLATPTPRRRAGLWAAALRDLGVQARAEATLDELANRYPIGALDIRESVRSAAFEASLAGASLPAAQDPSPPLTVTTAQLHRAVRERIAHKLGALAEPVSSALGWHDVILSDELRSRLQEMVNYGRNERRVFDDWGFGRLQSYGRGLTALFSGPPGTGKTLCAAVIAREIGLEAYFRVDLSRIVDKYIGETEKNLARVFDEAERSNALLLFDEADSLFAKRTGVKSKQRSLRQP